jgi:hypothetical protein
LRMPAPLPPAPWSSTSKGTGPSPVLDGNCRIASRLGSRPSVRVCGPAVLTPRPGRAVIRALAPCSLP